MTHRLNSYPGEVVMLDVPTDILCSYHYFKDSDLAQMRDWGTRIIGDSGAFSAETSGKPIDREAFHQWADRWQDALLWGASLDVIGDQPATQVNWLAAQQDGLDLVPTIHYPTDPKVLDWYVERGASLVGLGGMVAYSGEPQRLMRWLLSVFRYQRDNHPELRFHGWGISHPLLMDNLPWWSADSSGFTSAFRFGTMRLFDVPKGKFVSVNLNGSDMRAYAGMLRKYYDGIDWRAVSRSVPGNRRDVGRVALKALQHYGRWLRGRQQVSPPRLLAAKTEHIGPASVAVMSFPGSAQWRAVEPGPIAVGAVGRAGSGTAAIHPDNRASSPAAGPLVAGAPADPQMGHKYLAHTEHPTNVGSPSGVLDSLYAINTTGETPS